MEHPGRSAPGYYEYHILLCPNHGPVAARSRRIWSGQLEIACMVVPEPRISATRAAAAGVKCAAARRATRSWPSGPQPKAGRLPHKITITATLRIRLRVTYVT